MQRNAWNAKSRLLAYPRPGACVLGLSAPLHDQFQSYKPQNAEERAAMEQVYAAEVTFSKTSSCSLRSSLPSARIVELLGANLYVFLSDEADTLPEMRAFVAVCIKGTTNVR
jgi:hypothetical protein